MVIMASKPEKSGRLPTVRLTFEDLKAVSSHLKQERQSAMDQVGDRSNTHQLQQQVSTNSRSRSPTKKDLSQTERDFNSDKQQRGVLSLPWPQGNRLCGSGRRVDHQERRDDVQHVKERESETLVPDDLSWLDTRLSNLLSRDEEGKQVETVMRLQTQLRDECENLVLKHPDTAHSSDILQFLWKSGYHQVIEWLRNSVLDSGILTTFLEDACHFYQRLVCAVQERNGFTVKTYNPLTTHIQAKRKTRVSMLMCHKCYMCLGDLARYQQQHHSTTDYGLARKFYLKAQLLAPKNGLAYNQLAVTAVLARRKLDAVYYYMRSLAVSQPFINAREKLIALFEDARRRDRYLVNQQQETKKRRVKVERKDQKQRRVYKHQTKPVHVDEVKEMWVFPTHTVSDDGREVDVRGKDSEMEETAQLHGETVRTGATKPPSSSELVLLNKQVTARFILLHGLLFTKVAVEQFDILLSKFLEDIQLLWTSMPSSTDWQTLVQMTAMCLFSVWNTSQMGGPGGEVMKVRAQHLGLSVAQIMSSTILGLIESCENEEQTWTIPERALCFLPALSVWANVFLENHETWLCTRRCEVQSFLSSFAELLNCLLHTGVTDRGANHHSLILPEDNQLSGFVPLQDIHSKKLSELMQEDGASCNTARLHKLFELGDLLCYPEPRLLSFNGEFYECVRHQGNVDQPGTETEELETHPADGAMSGEESDDVIVEEEVDGTASENEELRSEGVEEMSDAGVSELIARKRELAAQMAQQQKREENIREIVEQQKAHKQVVTQIQPKYLVPDTNCFIDELDLIEQLAKTPSYTLAVPLVVFNELDGLAKGSETPANVKQAEKVVQHALASGMFIEDCFKRKRLNVCLLTSSGNLLNTTTFRLQDSSSVQGNNDDIILAGCIQLNQRTTKQSVSGSIQEVVLLTDDRNLRVKALAKNIAVCNMQRFLKLAKITPP